MSALAGDMMIEFKPDTFCKSGMTGPECLEAGLEGTEPFEAYLYDPSSTLEESKGCGFSTPLVALQEETTKKIFMPHDIVLTKAKTDLAHAAPKVFVTTKVAKCHDPSAAVASTFDASSLTITAHFPALVKNAVVYASFDNCTDQEGDDPGAFIKYQFKYSPTSGTTNLVRTLTGPAFLLFALSLAA